MKRIAGFGLLIVLGTMLVGVWPYDQAEAGGNVGGPSQKRAATNAVDFNVDLQVSSLATPASCYSDPTIIASGSATGFAASTLTDSTKNYTVNALVGKPVSVFGSTINSGQQVTYTDSTVTATGATWTPGALVGLPVVSEYILGGRLSPTILISSVSYTDISFTDTSHSLVPGSLIGLEVVANVWTGTVAANTATTVTLSANWAKPIGSASQPPADTLYAVVTPQASSFVAANTADTITITGEWTAPNPIKDTRLTINVPAAKVSGAGGPVTFGSSSLTDTSKSFVSNQLVGSTVVAISSPVTGSGGTVTYASHTGVGAPVTYGPTTVTDTSKNYAVGSIIGKEVISGPVSGTISANTATTITINPGWTEQPSPGNQYVVAWLTDTTSGKFGAANAQAGKLVRSGSNEATVLSSTANTLHLATIWSPSTPSTGAAYEITPTSYAQVVTSNTATVVNMNGDWVPVPPPAGTAYFIKVPQVDRTIASNTDKVITVTSPWAPAIPAAGSTYQVANSQPTSPCGLGGYSVVINFDPAKLQYISATNTTYLASTGRSLIPSPCNPVVTTGQIVFTCNTSGLNGLPLGATANGSLATLKFKPLGALNTSTVITQDTTLTDIEATTISHTENDTTILFSRCADVSGNGAVTLSDAVAAVQFVGLSSVNDPNWAAHVKYDMNQSTAITLSDAVYIVDQVGQLCTYIP